MYIGPVMLGTHISLSYCKIERGINPQVVIKFWQLIQAGDNRSTTTDHSSDSGEKWEYNQTVLQVFIDFKKAYDSVIRWDNYCPIVLKRLAYP
jgi:hypothetical protein